MIKNLSLIREQVSLSEETVNMLKELNILLINCSNISYELIKNLCLLNIKRIGLFGEDIINENDMNFNYIFQRKNKKKLKKEVLKKWGDHFSSLTNIKLHGNNFDDIEEIIKEYDIIVVSDYLVLKSILKIDEICQKLNKKLIFTGAIGNMAFSFFNLNYLKMTERFLTKDQIPILNITQGNPGIVKTLKRHSFLKGDFIWIENLNGMGEITPDEIRPITGIIDNYQFTIENTTNYSKYIDGGFVSGANFPKNIKYSSLKNQFNSPTFNLNLSKEENYKNHFNILMILHILEVDSYSFIENFEKLYEECQKKIEKFSFYNVLNKDILDKDEVLYLLKAYKYPKATLNHFFIANIISCEITKLNGKSKPFQQTLYLKFIKNQEENLKNILSKNIFLIGAGGKAQEILKQFIYITSFLKENIIINISDDSLLTKSSLGTNFFFKNVNTKTRKDKKLTFEINSMDYNVKLNLIEKSQFINTMNKSDIVIITIDDFEKILNFSELALLTEKELFITNEFKRELRCLKIYRDNKEYLEEYYQKKIFEVNLLKLNLDNPNGSLDCIRWTSLIFELVFQHFFLDESFFNDVNKKSPFYYLILFLKTRIYKFLLFQKHKLENIINEGVFFFHIIFKWYYHIMNNWDFSYSDNHKEEIIDIIDKFDTENPLHLKFVVSFVNFFNKIFTKSLASIKDEEIIDILKNNYSEIELPINKFNPDYFIQDFKTCYNEINYADKFQNFYNILEDLRFYYLVKDFAGTINDIKMGIHGFECYTTNEFDYFFFDIVSTVCFSNSFVANFVFWKINQEDEENNIFINWQNTSMKII